MISSIRKSDNIGSIRFNITEKFFTDYLNVW